MNLDDAPSALNVVPISASPDDRMLLVYRVDLVLDVPDDVTVRGGMTVTVTPP